MKVINQDEYGEVICQYFHREFFNQIQTTQKDLLEVLTSVFISTKEFRYGPIPEPESLVTIRKTIKKSIELGHPIPILVPWGGRKAKVDDTIDVAEVFAITQLQALQVAVKKYFSPGITINLRIEDTNADWIYRGNPTSEAAVKRYSSDFETLLKMLTNFINPMKESVMMNKDEYFHRSATLAPLIEQVLTHQIAFPNADISKLKEFQQLQELGWKGTFPAEQRDYYRQRYGTLYPDLKDEEYVKMLADYFAGSKARHDMKALGNPVTPVGSYIVVAFVPPVPGAPASMFDNRVYWRTVPYSNGRTHIPAWRAKGYFKIINGNEAKAKVISYNDPIVKELVPSSTTLWDDKNRLEIRSDYVIE